MIFRCGRLARAEGARGDDDERLRLHHGDPLAGLRLPGLDRDLLEPLDRLGRACPSRSRRSRRSGTGRERPARSPGTCWSSGSQAAMAWSNFFSVTKLSPIWNRSSGHASVERVLGDEVGPGGAGLGEVRRGRDGRRRSGAGCRGSHAGRRRSAGRWETWPGSPSRRRSPRRTSAGPEGSRRPGTTRHRQLGPVAPGLVGLDLEALLLEELREGLECLGALAARPVRRADRYAARTASGCAGIGRQEPPQGRDAQVQAGVVGRIGDAVGRGDLVERIGPDRGDVLGELGRLQRSMSRARSVQVSRAGRG